MTSTASYILLVDDEPDNLFLLEELLQLSGYQTQSALTGDEALALMRQAPPDLVLLDVMMPGMDGFQVCQELRADPTLQSLPVIFLTALDDDDSRLRGLELMGDDYLTKPVQSRLMLAKVASTLQLHQLRAQQTAHQMQQQLRDQVKLHTAAAWKVSEALMEKLQLFVPEQFLQRIAPRGLDSIELGNATEAEMAVLFCDIREFTAIAESQQVSETFAWLNAFFQGMNQAITSHDGFIDKYLGDAIMAVFDRPQYQAQDALNAAVAMRQTLLDFNQTRSRFNLEQPLNIGIGVHVGPGLIGTVGSNLRMDSTVIGDVVNTASRLEELTKVYGCQILASQMAIAQLPQSALPDAPDAFHIRRIDRVLPRGKQQIIDLYEVICTTGQPLDAAKLQTQALFQQAITAWDQQDWPLAEQYFRQVLQQNPEDTVAQLYVERCRNTADPEFCLIPRSV